MAATYSIKCKRSWSIDYKFNVQSYLYYSSRNKPKCAHFAQNGQSYVIFSGLLTSVMNIIEIAFGFEQELSLKRSHKILQSTLIFIL
jgi:hypothetical protein